MLSALLVIATLAWAPGSETSPAPFTLVEARDGAEDAHASVIESTRAMEASTPSDPLKDALEQALTALEAHPRYLVANKVARSDRIKGYKALAWGYMKLGEESRAIEAISQAYRLAEPHGEAVDWSNYELTLKGAIAKVTSQARTGAIEVECKTTCDAVYLSEWTLPASQGRYSAGGLYPGSYRVLVAVPTASGPQLWEASIEVQRGTTAKLVWAVASPPVAEITLPDYAITLRVRDDAPRTKRRTGIGLTAGGAAVAIVGLGLVIDVQTKWGQAPRDVYGLRSLYRTGWVCLGSGLVIATVGTVLMALNSKRRTERHSWQLRGGAIAF